MKNALLTLTGLLLITALLTGCGTTQQQFQVLGHEQDIAELTGRWVGDYYNAETGNSGSIVFSLAASTDTAYGDVMMLARGSSVPFRPFYGEPAPENEFRKTRSLTINFVMIEDRKVSGTLFPYKDEVCGCVVFSTFEGTLSGDKIEGKFITRFSDGRVTEGEWKVVRTTQTPSI
ncbi:MAG: hypothetical protein HY562_09090 [Ignavibacteriales bacterium]|nr:hypothetical protein [Ignavibacteriales bacterium]